MKKSILISLITALTLTVFSSCASKSQPVGGEPEDTTVTTVTSETTTPPPPADSLVKITAAGDNLIHSSIYNQAKKRSTDGTYDFDYAYENVEKLIFILQAKNVKSYKMSWKKITITKYWGEF